MATYYDLFQVEASSGWRRPTSASISAHLTVVFAALAITRHLYATIRRVVRALRPLLDATISIDGHQLTAVTPPEGEAADILAALHPAAGH